MNESEDSLEFATELTELTEEKESNSWMVTYADMITLMLTFFILLYSISNLELEKFKKIMESIKISFGVMPSVPADSLKFESSKEENFSPYNGSDAGEKEYKKRKKRMLEEIVEFIKKRGLHESIIVTLEHSRIVIRIKDKIFFESGSADFNPDAIPILKDIIEIFETYSEFSIDIAGHTDDNPISTLRFPSNWELSTIRATTVLRNFIDSGIDPHRLTATGFADILPLVPNDNDYNRSINRRVEFILAKDIELLD